MLAMFIAMSERNVHVVAAPALGEPHVRPVEPLGRLAHGDPCLPEQPRPPGRMHSSLSCSVGSALSIRASPRSRGAGRHDLVGRGVDRRDAEGTQSHGDLAAGERGPDVVPVGSGSNAAQSSSSSPGCGMSRRQRRPSDNSSGSASGCSSSPATSWKDGTGTVHSSGSG